MELLVATKNKNKLEEIKEILKNLNFKITSLLDHSISIRIREDGKTFKENAIKKAVKVAKLTQKLTLGEDSGLCVEVLGGRPGVFSSRFAGRDKNDLKNNLKLLKLLGDLALPKRKAYYVCAIALADRSGLIKVVEGKCFGYIGFELKGKYGFGYDPLFIPRGYKRTFAQLGTNIKHRISHRYIALKKIIPFLEKYKKIQRKRRR